MSDVERITELEELVRAHNRLEAAMYDGDLEVHWPTEATALQRAYEAKYGVDLDGGAS